MATLVVPHLDPKPWPTLGPAVVDFLRERCIFGPGSLKGEPYEPSPDWVACIHAMYEVYPKGHRLAGRRRFKRVGISVRKGLAKTELMAAIAYVELHPDGPVRCDGFDAYGRPVARPVRDPYIPLLAYQKEQVEELAFGALAVICTEGPDADLFDVTLERIVRIGPTGRADGKAVALANSPSARDGARTTFQGFDEPHRMFLPRLIDAHNTMVANLEKRALEDPWGLYVGTSGEPGQGSVQEGLHAEAVKIEEGRGVEEPRLFYFMRWADARFDKLDTIEQRLDAIKDASGPNPEYALGQFESIAEQWDSELADKGYLERVWLNRWTKSAKQALNLAAWKELSVEARIQPGAFVTIGFDGARRQDSTAIVITEIATGLQQLWALWERPEDADKDWEIDDADVNDAIEMAMATFQVWKAYCDPPYWMEEVGTWAGKWPDVFEEHWTNRRLVTSREIKAYREAIATGNITHEKGRNLDLERRFDLHIGAAGRHDLAIWDPDSPEEHLFIFEKLHPDRKFDAAMASVLSWAARMDAIRAGAKPRKRTLPVPIRVR